MSNQNPVVEYLERQSKAIGRLAVEVSRRSDEKPVHKLRVATRRARAALWVLKNSSAHLHFKRLDHDLRRLCRELGKVREVDVAILDASHYGIDSSKLEIQRKKFLRKVRELITQDQMKRLMNKLSEAEISGRARDPILLYEASKRLRSRLNMQLEWNAHGEMTKPHRLRITMKKARYVLEAMGRPIDPMKPLQDALGDAHDLDLLQVLTEEKSKIKVEKRSLNNKAITLVRPALRFAVDQLEGVLDD